MIGKPKAKAATKRAPPTKGQLSGGVNRQLVRCGGFHEQVSLVAFDPTTRVHVLGVFLPGA
jgi:hypothetical protein